MATTRPTILVVEDEAAIAETLVYALRTEGFEVAWKTTGGEALAEMRARPISLVILDVGLPDGSGFDFCRTMRGVADVPIIFLTARSDPVDRIVGLEIGADDYVAKPFSPREVTARVRAVLRRGQRSASSPAQPNGRWSHDTGRCRIVFDGHPLELTRNEYRLLAAFLAAPGRVYSREQLMNLAWEDPGSATDRTVDAHVKSLRAKLRLVAPELDPIATHRGLGYSLREEA